MSEILLIDDNPRNNSRYIKDLKRHHNVVVAMKLISAERLLKQRHFNIIIIDVMMPTQNLKDHHDETTTGFVFYRRMMGLFGPRSLVVFWSRIDESRYREYWQNIQMRIPDNTYFIHKTNSNSHLTEGIDEILRQNNLFY